MFISVPQKCFDSLFDGHVIFK